MRVNTPWFAASVVFGICMAEIPVTPRVDRLRLAGVKLTMPLPSSAGSPTLGMGARPGCAVSSIFNKSEIHVLTVAGAGNHRVRLIFTLVPIGKRTNSASRFRAESFFASPNGTSTCRERFGITESGFFRIGSSIGLLSVWPQKVVEFFMRGSTIGSFCRCRRNPICSFAPHYPR